MRNKLAFRVALGAVTLLASACSLPAFARYDTFVSGTGALTFDAGLVGALTSGGVVIDPILPATYANGVVTSQVNGVTLNGNYEPTEIFSLGGALQSAPSNFASSGGQVRIENLDVVINDLTHIDVYADVSGNNGLVSQSRMLMWTSTGLTADSETSVTGPSFHSTLKDLYITDAGKAALIQGLGLNSIGQGVLNGVNSYGTLSTTMQFADNSIDIPAVPEPSTYMLMLVGFGLTGWVARRRSR